MSLIFKRSILRFYSSFQGLQFAPIHFGIICQVFERSNIDGASVEEQHRNIDIFDCVSNTLVILNGVVLAKVKSHGTGLDLGKLGLEFIKFLLDLAESSADDADVEALLGHLSANLEADTVRATCD